MLYDTEICVAAGERFSSTCIFTPKGLAELFNGYNKGKEGFISFCKGENSWRAPNAELVRFNYCPNTGIKIDWDEVLNYGLSFFSEK